MKHIPFIKPSFPEPSLISQDLEKIYTNNYYSNNGPVYFEFKEKIEQYLGQGLHAVVVSNATAGLMISIQAVFKPKSNSKKYIAIPSFTFAAGPLAIKWCGFEPLFFDVDVDTAQPSLDSFKTILGQYKNELAGVVLLNNFGIGNRQIDKWTKLLLEEGLLSIIDSAPGFGSTYENGNLIGGATECEIFSFHATKPFGIGEGGLITTKNKELAEELESLKNFGFDDRKTTIFMGTNAKITELDCAIGLRILANYSDRLTDRRKTYDIFESKLRKVPGVSFLPNAASAAIQFASIMVPADKQKTILDTLKDGGVEARSYYAPGVHESPLFKNAPKVNLPHTQQLSQTIISLPVHPHMDKEDIHYICDIITRLLDEKS
jgi:dTDP-4-amino-4,6-dideoxygalactose transaminase